MRFVLRRENEVLEPLKKEMDKYFHIGKENLLIDQSKLSLIYRKGDTRYRLNWSANADIPSLEQEENKKWVASPGEIQSLFPVYIYSQKQIFELAKNPQALIEIIDSAPEVDVEKIRTVKEELEYEYKRNIQKIQELQRKISQQWKLQGELKDLERQISEIERSGHKQVLQNYRKREQQLNEITTLEKTWKKMAEWLENNQDEIFLFEINAEIFSEHPDILAMLNQTNNKWKDLNKGFKLLLQKAQSIVKQWDREKGNADWMRKLKEEMSRYEQLRTQFEQEGIDPNQYPLLLRQQQVIQKQLDDVGEFEKQKDKLLNKREQLLTDIKNNRDLLTNNRKKFLQNILETTESVHIEVLRMSEDKNDIEKKIRSILQCPSRFNKDINHLMDKHTNSPEYIQELKDVIQDIRTKKKDPKDQRFANHLQTLPQESFDDLMLWFPNDGLKITFGSRGQRIQSGSPGQKTAALLAFILSYGCEPLLLDQPEDDLDNELIYDLIVQQLRKTKSKRQIIVVTHNANIVVNGDAEMVLPVMVIKGQSYIKHPASIQNNDTRERICNILEGGRQAFEQRYRRIHLERENA